MQSQLSVLLVASALLGLFTSAQGSLFIPTHEIRSALKRDSRSADGEGRLGINGRVCAAQVLHLQGAVDEKMGEVGRLLEEIKILRDACRM